MCGSDICLGIIAIFFPPLAVWVKRGICSADSIINIALCFLGVIPGILHAWYIISITPDPTYDELAQQDPERGHVTHYYISQQPAPRQQAPPPRGYGTVQGGVAPKPHAPSQQQHYAPAPAPSAQAAAGPSTDTPPSYQQVVDGDHKVQKS